MKKILSATAFCALNAIAAAQEAATATAEETAAGGSLTLRNIIVQGGCIMYVLVGLSVVALMLIIYYLLTLRMKVVCPVSFLHAAQDAADAADLESLQALAGKESSAAGRIVLAGCQHHDSTATAESDHEAMLKAVEDEGARQVSGLWSQLQYLMDVATLAPMVGLLGTVWGMMVSFTGLESGLNMINKADRLASGVSQAMFTTFGGLIIGIASIVAYALFRGRVNRLIGNLEAECGAIFRRLAAARRRNAGK